MRTQDVTFSKGDLFNIDVVQKWNYSQLRKEPQMTKLVNEILARLNDPSKGDSAIKPATKFVELCVKNKINSKMLSILDRQLHAKDTAFQIAENKANFVRWNKWDFNSDVFVHHYEEAKYLLNSPLGNQMKIFKDPIIMQDHLPGILVAGQWTSIQAVQDQFEIKYLPKFKEKFMVLKGTEDVYTFLDNGRGLQEHNPYTAETLSCPLTRLSDDEFDRTWIEAMKFKRTDDERSDDSRTFIFQIVSSYITNSQNNNAMELLYRRKHPWIRVICGRENPEFGTKKGDVFEIGFGWTAPSKLVAKTTEGRFRVNGDLWNFKTAEQRVVTNIAITPEEADEILQYILGFHSRNIHPSKADDKIAFNLWSQNCSAFVHHIAKKAGVHAPTQIYLTELIARISPNWLKAIGRGFLSVKSGVKSAFSAVVPSFINKPLTWAIHMIRDIGLSIANFVLVRPFSLISLALGGGSGAVGREFTRNAHVKVPLGSRLNFKNFFSLRRFHYHLPGILQEWQRKQPSTVIYKDTVKLSIVPPQES